MRLIAISYTHNYSGGNPSVALTFTNGTNHLTVPCTDNEAKDFLALAAEIFRANQRRLADELASATIDQPLAIAEYSEVDPDLSF